MDAAGTLFEAYFRRGGQEDRVTEVFAAVLQQVPALVTALAHEIGLETAKRYRVETQVRAGAWVVDMRITAVDTDGASAWTLWCEHKVGSGFGEGQLPRYRAAVGTDPLLAITSLPLTALELEEAHAAQAHLLNWHHVLKLTHRLAPNDPLQRHLLSEWGAVCAHELQEVHVEPLDARGVDALRPADVAVETLNHLMRTSFTRACETVGAGAPVEKDWWEATPPEGSWLAQEQCLLFMDLEIDDARFSGPGHPAIVVGAYGPWRDPGDLRGNVAAKDLFESRGFTYADFGGPRTPEVTIARTISLGELVGSALLTEQEELLAERTEGILRDLVEVRGL